MHTTYLVVVVSTLHAYSYYYLGVGLMHLTTLEYERFRWESCTTKIQDKGNSQSEKDLTF